MRLHILGIATAILAIVFSTQTTRAQLVSGNGFLQGKYLEVGMAQCGSFGSSVFAPTGYHTQGSSYLGFVADVDKDGWTSGTPGFIGDYFRPGSPEEGFTIEINGYNYSNNQVCGVNNIPGSITSVDNSGSTVTMVWEGNIGNLGIKQTVEFDTNTVFFAVSVELTNNGPANLNNIYYMRNVDPDNEVPNGGSYTTTNTIVQQNPNPSNIALVKATGLSYGSILALGSKDPRARVTHGGFSNRNASAIYNGTSYYTSGTNTADQAISIAFDIGDLSPTETSCLTFFYMFDETEYATALSSASLECIDLFTYGVPQNICPEDSFYVSYELDTANVNPNTGNIFTVQLSDSTGSFATPTVLATSATSGYPQDSILVSIPSSIPYGDGYRIRVNTSSPLEIGADNGYDLTIGFPQPNFGPTTITCSGNPTTLSVSPGAQYYVWSNGNTTNSINVTTSGTYSVTVLNGGCIDTFSTAVTAQLSPIFFLADTLYSCNTDSTLVSAGAGYPSYTWSTGSTTNTTYVDESGYVYCTVAGLTGCTKTDSTYVNAIDARISASTDSICAGEVVELSSDLITSCLNILSLTNDNASYLDIESYISDDYGSIAVTPNYIYYTGDLATVRLDADDFSSPVQYLKREGLFSDIGNGNLYTFWNVNLNGFNQNNITTLRRLNENLTAVEDITLSSTIIAGNGRNGLFVSDGYVYLFASYDEHFYQIDLDNGQVTDLGLYNTFDTYLPYVEGWAFYGIAQCDDAGISVIHKHYYYNQIVSYSLSNYTYSTLENYSSSISELSSITFSKWNTSWYYQIEGASVFGSGNEVLGKANAQLGSFELDYSWSTGDSSTSIVKSPTATTTYTLSISDEFHTCSSSKTVTIAGTPPSTLNDTIYTCDENLNQLVADSNFASYKWNTGSTSQSITAPFPQTAASVDLIDSFGCSYTKEYVLYNLGNPFSYSVDTAISYCGDDTMTLAPFPYGYCHEISNINFNDHTLQEIGSTIGADRGGIAVTKEHVFYTGMSGTYRLNKDLSGITALPMVRGLVSDVQTNRVLSMADTNGGAPFSICNALLVRDAAMNITDTIALSEALTIGSQAGIFTGVGYVVIYSESQQRLSKVYLQTGEVEFLTSVNLSMPYTEEYAHYGMASCNASGELEIIYSNGSSFNQYLYKYNLSTGYVSSFLVASNYTGFLEGMVYSPFDGRVYFHVEGSTSLFGSGSQRIGYSNASLTGHDFNFTWDDGFSETVRTDKASELDGLGITISNSAISCSDTSDISTSSSAGITLADTTVSCEDSVLLSITPSPAYTSYTWNTGETTSSIYADEIGYYSVNVIDTNGCSNTSRTLVIPVSSTIHASELASCNGDTVTLSVSSDLAIPTVLDLSLESISYIDINSYSGDNRGSIAADQNYVYYTGDSYTARVNKDLTGLTYLTRTDKLFSDLKTGQLYAFQYSTSPSQVYKKNSSMGTDAVINLSDPLTSSSYVCAIFSGYGYAIYAAYVSTYTYNFYKVDLPSGNVTLLNNNVYAPYLFADYTHSGFVVETDTGYNVVYNQQISSSTSFTILDINTGNTQPYKEFGIYPGNVDGIAIDPWDNKWYVHHEYNSNVFGVGSEVLNAMNATILPAKSILWSTGDTIRTIKVAPTASSTYSVDVSYGGLSCEDSIDINVAVSAPLVLADTTVSCDGSVSLSVSNTYNSYNWSTGESTNSITVDSVQLVTIDVIDSNLCELHAETFAVPLSLEIIPSTPNICSGDSVVLEVAIGEVTCSRSFEFDVTNFNITSPSYTYDDNSGIAITDQYLYVTSDYSTIRFDKNTLAQTNYTATNGIFSDIGDYQLYRFANNTSSSYYYYYSTTTHIAKLNSTLGVTQYIPLSQSLTFTAGSGIFSGDGFVIVFNNYDNYIYHIDLSNGDVTNLGLYNLSTELLNSEGWTIHGVATCSENGGYDLYYRNGTSYFKKFNTSTQTAEIIYTLASGSFGDLHSFVVSPQDNRWYFFYEFSNSPFSGSYENIGYADASSIGLNEIVGIWNTNDTANSIIEYPTSASTYSVYATLAGTTCYDTVDILVATQPTLNLDSSYAGCSNSGVTITLPTHNYYEWSDGATTGTRTINESGVYWARVADTVGCWGTDTTIVANIESTIYASELAKCSSDPVQLFVALTEDYFEIQSFETNITNGDKEEMYPNIIDDYSSIAVTPKHVFITGDNATLRYNANDLSDMKSFGPEVSIYSDIRSGKLYKFWNTSTASFSGSITDIVELDSNLNAIDTIPLSSSITLNTNIGSDNGVFVGPGFVILYCNYDQNFYRIDNSTGEVETLSNLYLGSSLWYAEGWASYGVAEVASGIYSVYYKSLSSNYIGKCTGLATISNTYQFISSLGDMPSFTYNPWLGRWYGSYEGYGMFGSGTESIFYLEASDVSPYSFDWSTGDTTRNISVTPTSTSTYYVQVTLGSDTCNDSITIQVPTVTTSINLPDTILSCDSVVSLSAPAGFTNPYWNNNSYATNYEVDRFKNVRLVAIDSFGCSRSDNTIVWPIAGAITTNVASNCVGETATATFDYENKCLNVSSLTNSSALSNVFYSTYGDDDCGIAVTPNFIYASGNSNAVKMNPDDLSIVSYFYRPWQNNIFSDLGNGDLYAMWSMSGGTYPTAYNILLVLDEDLQSIDTVTLSTPIQRISTCQLYMGSGFVLLYNGIDLYSVDLGSGEVTVEAYAPSIPAYNSEGWASYGVAECGFNGYELLFRHSSYHSIARYNVNSGGVSFVASFSNLGDMANFVVSPWNNRWYGVSEFYTQFYGSSYEHIFSGSASTSDPLSATLAWSNGGTGDSTSFTLDSTTNVIGISFNTGCTSCPNCNYSDTITADSSAITSVTVLAGNNCEGDLNGQAQVFASGGTGPYSYVWSNGDTTALADSLSGGIKYVSVTNSNGCVAIDSADISEPDPISIVNQVLPPTCDGDMNGSITLTVTGPRPPYTFLWTDGTTTNYDSNLVMGTYAVTITDSSGCTFERSYSLNNTATPNPPTPLTVSQTEVCSGSPVTLTAFSGLGSGSITTYTSTTPVQSTFTDGDTLYFQFTNMPNVFTETAVLQVFYKGDLDGVDEYVTYYSETGALIGTSDSTAGCGNFYGSKNFNITAAQFNNWNLDDTITIMAVTENAVNLCSPKFQGYVRFNYIKGTQTYWFTDGCLEDKTLAYDSASSFTLIPDSNMTFYAKNFSGGCWSDCDSISFLVKESAELTLNFDTINLCDLTSINLKAEGADATFWAPSTGLNLVVGDSIMASPTNDITYTAYGQNLNGCVDTAYVRVNVNEALFLSDTIISNLDCFGDSDGSIAVAIDGGNEPYSYTWSTGATGTTVQSGLTAGNYWIFAEDTVGQCRDTFYLDVVEPDSFRAVFNKTDISCNGETDGTIGLSFTGGTAPYTWIWGFGSTSDTLSNLSAGNYHVIATDANSCLANDTVEIIEPAPIVANASIIQDAFCTTVSNGSAVASHTGGTGSVTYLWSNGNTTDTASNLAIGSHWVEITDSNGCYDTAYFSITNVYPDVFVSLDSTSNVLCFGDSTGAAYASATGTGSFTFDWSYGPSGAENLALPIGTYTLTATDSVGCFDTTSFAIAQPNNLVFDNLTIVNAVCNGDSSGSISVSNLGGTSPYTYSWNTGSTGNMIAGLPSGNYSVTVTDSNGCVIDSSVVITEPLAMVITLDSTENNLCNQDSLGFVAVSIANAQGAYSVTWSNGDTNLINDSLAAGTYSVTITDSAGCSISDTFTITAPPALVMSFSIDSLQCFGFSDANIKATIAGGTMPYSYNWSNGATSDSIAGLTAGWYILTVTDANGCSLIDSTEVIQGDSMFTTFTVISNPACLADSSGSALVNVTGGTAPHTYNWNNGSTNDTLSGVSGGYHFVTITDNKGCTHVDSVEISIINLSYSIAIDSLENVSCYNADNGFVSIEVTGTTGPYTYAWPNGDSTATTDSLAAGSYVVTVTDALGCADTMSVSISQPDILVASIDSVYNINCFGDSTGWITSSVSGGTMPYTFNWSDGTMNDTISGIASGVYYMTITDANGCSAVDSAEVTDLFASLNVVSSASNVLCNGDSTGNASLVISGGAAPYIINWNNGSDSTFNDSLIAGTYFYTITDSVGCSFTDSVMITEPSSLSISLAGLAPVICNDDANGSVMVSAVGGTAPVNYNWSNGFTTDTLENISSGTYIVTATDANGCTVVDSIEVSNPTPLYANLTTIQHITCADDSNGLITTSPFGGVGPYNYLWSTGDTALSIDTLLEGSYSFTVTDSLGCSTDTTIVLNELDSMRLNVISAIDLNCYEANDGIVTLDVDGGSATTSITWNGITGTDYDSTLSAGTYTIIANNASCSDSVTVTLTQPDSLYIQLDSLYDITCYGAMNGVIGVSGVGGVGSYGYQWSSGSTFNVINATDTSVYTVTLTDGNGCTAIDSFQATEPDSLDITLVANMNASCYSIIDSGYLEVSVSGGTMPYTYNWSNGSDSAVAMNLAPGTHTLTLTDANGCSKTFTDIIARDTFPIVTMNSLNPMCVNDDSLELQIGAPIGGMYYGTGVGSGFFNPQTSGDGSFEIFYTYTDGNGCADTNSTFVTVDSMPVVTFDSVPTVCLTAGSITLTQGLPAGGTYFGAGISGNNFDPAITGVGTFEIGYQVTTAGGCSDTAYRQILVYEFPEVSFVDTNELCGNGIPVQLTGGLPTGGIYIGTGVSNGIFNPSEVSAPTAQVGYTYSDVCGTDTAWHTITINSFPTPSLGADVEVCANDTVFIESLEMYESYQWSTGSSNPNQILFGENLLMSEGIVELTVGNEFGCYGSTSIQLTVNDTVSLNLTDTLLCHDDSLMLYAPEGNNTYFWSDSSSTRNLLAYDGSSARPEIFGYRLTVTNEFGCVSTDSMTIETINCDSLQDLGYHTLYPNPSTGDFTVEYFASKEQVVRVDVYDAVGKVVFNQVQNAKPGKNWVDVDGTLFGSGVFLVRFFVDDILVAEKVVIN